MNLKSNLFHKVFLASMPKFLFQPDPNDGYEFWPIPIYIGLGVIEIPTGEILDVFTINNTDTVIVGTNRKHVLAWLQEYFVWEFHIG